MGKIRQVLADCHLSPREPHNSRLFVDLAENVHIHHRELRTVFSVREFLEYVDVVSSSGEDVKAFLAAHQEYKEQRVFGTLMIALGSERQFTPLANSPQPHESVYFDDTLRIELQDEAEIDEIHVHYRDYRLVMNQDTFRRFAQAMQDAVIRLDGFLTTHRYAREETPHACDEAG